MSSPFIPLGSIVLVTGINSFVGAQVAVSLVEAGYRVRGTVRSQQKSDDYLKSLPSSYRKAVSVVVVPDIVEPAAFSQAVKDVAAVCHVASPFHWKVTDNERDMLKPAVEGTKNLLAAIKYESSVKRVVITSSFAAVLDLTAGLRVGHTYTENDWNPVKWDDARFSKNIAFVYCASKTFAERAAWDEVRNSQLHYDVVSVNPTMVFGPSAFAPEKISGLGTSLESFWNAISGDCDIPETHFPYFVDVRDLAIGHRLCLQIAAAGGQRYLMSADRYTFSQIAQLVKQEIPTAPTKSTDKPTQMDSYVVDNSKVRRELGLEFRSAETTFLDTARQLFKLKANEEKPLLNGENDN